MARKPKLDLTARSVAVQTPRPLDHWPAAGTAAGKM
jgi:hypothetical protein